MMESYSLLLWFARAMLQYVFFFAMLLPATMDVKIDSTKFLEAFSMKRGGSRVNLSSWEHAPGQPSSSSSSTSSSAPSSSQRSTRSSPSSSSSAVVPWQNPIDAHNAWLKEHEASKDWIPRLFKDVVVDDDGEEEVEEEDEDMDVDEESSSKLPCFS